jgi:hypothetical protein
MQQKLMQTMVKLDALPPPDDGSQSLPLTGWHVHMLFKLGQAAEQTWRRQRRFNYLAKVITSVTFKDGIQVETSDRIAA